MIKIASIQDQLIRECPSAKLLILYVFAILMLIYYFLQSLKAGDDQQSLQQIQLKDLAFNNKMNFKDLFIHNISQEHSQNSGFEKYCEITTSNTTQNNSLFDVLEPFQAESESFSNRQNTGGLFVMKSGRKKRIIQTCQQTQRLHQLAVKGHKSQTTELNINLKTYLKIFLREQDQIVKFNEEQKKLINNFENSNANFESIRQLFGVRTEDNSQKVNGQLKIVKVIKNSDRIRLKCYKNFTSTNCVKNMMSGRRMSTKNKLIMIKFMEGIRNSCISPQNFISWK